MTNKTTPAISQETIDNILASDAKTLRMPYGIYTEVDVYSYRTHSKDDVIFPDGCTFIECEFGENSTFGDGCTFDGCTFGGNTNIGKGATMLATHGINYLPEGCRLKDEGEYFDMLDAVRRDVWRVEHTDDYTLEYSDEYFADLAACIDYINELYNDDDHDDDDRYEAVLINDKSGDVIDSYADRCRYN